MPPDNQPSNQLDWDPDLIRRYDSAGPRYTSYPTAMQFSPHFGQDRFVAAVRRSNAKGRPLSLYVHLPFCKTVCYYCACNKIITGNEKRITPYLRDVAAEIGRVATLIDDSRPVVQIHWGGGTPTYLNHAQMTGLMECIHRHFTVVPQEQGEFSIELHPGLMEANTIDHLRHIGFNRLSMGVQDFNPLVQTAVNRFNSVYQVQELVNRARQCEFRSISMDLIYGLPKQNESRFACTLNQVIDIGPDRISLFNYAHLPGQFKTQNQIDESQLPPPQEKLAMLTTAVNKLTGAGYVYIGMDHFARADDELAIAQQQGKLQRNFQGYSTSGGCDLLAFGVSAISDIDGVYAQNHKDLVAYATSIRAGKFPTAKGFRLNADDEIRRAVINQLICHFELNYAVLENSFNIDFNNYFANELISLQSMVRDGLLHIGPNSINVFPKGRPLIRHICMAFDAYLPLSISKDRYSKII